MPAYFFDSSAAVKRYVRETGTNWTIGLFRSPNQNAFYAARVTLVEVISAFTRRMKSGSLSPLQTGKAKTRFRRAFRRKFFKLEIDARLIERAAELAEKYALRGYDAAQLAAALTANDARISIGASALIFVSADSNLNNAAASEGLTVENPNNYP
jgi:uncharacterized protein